MLFDQKSQYILSSNKEKCFHTAIIIKKNEIM